jgi:hypothetical protein
MNTCAVVIATESMADQDGVILGRIEMSIGLIAERQLRELAPRDEFERLFGNKVLILDESDLSLFRDDRRLFGIIHDSIFLRQITVK